MYEEDHRFDTPRERNAKIWRYMCIEKYADAVRSRTLYFCRGEKLRDVDSYEGSYLSFELLRMAPPEEAKELARKMKSCGYPITVNCWHLNEFESFAMWRLYGDTIAIQSTVGRLIDAFARCPCEVRVGKVYYILPGDEPFTSNSVDIFTPWLHKRRGFEYERELRAIIWDTSEGIHRDVDGSVLAPVDTQILIESVYVSPKARANTKDAVQRINEAHGLNVPIYQSELARFPAY